MVKSLLDKPGPKAREGRRDPLSSPGKTDRANVVTPWDSPAPNDSTSEASRINSSSVNERAEATLQWIDALLPEASSVIAILAADGGIARVVAADTSLASANDMPSTDALGRHLSAALETEGISHSAVSGELRKAVPWIAEIGEQKSMLTCLALPAVSPTAVIAIFHTPDSGHLVDNALGSLTVLLCDSTLAAPNNLALNALISKAKREWEHTVDALDDLVLLVDRNSAVLRANRAVERWKLGAVGRVRGLTVHAVLHADCEDPSCGLERLLSDRWENMRTNCPTTFDYSDAHTAKDLQITLQPIDSNGGPPHSSLNFGVVVVKEVTELHTTQRKLRQLNDDLELRVDQRTKELQLKNEELREEVARREIAEKESRESRDELERLTEQLINAQECERHRISLELHDSIGQALGALKYSLERCVAVRQDPRLGDCDEILATTVTMLQRTINDARSISMSLRPSLLDDLGAVSAVNWLCQWFSDTYEDICITTNCLATDSEVPDYLATPVFRVIQEALNNVAKHASAHSALVLLRRQGSKLSLEVRDDGAGFDTRHGQEHGLHGMGILGMRERVTMTGGTFALKSARNAGTRVRAEWEISA